MDLLRVEGIQTFYGTSHILSGVSLNVKKGEIVSLLGRNGAGKTTTLRSIMGLTPPKSGSVFWAGEEITGCPSHIIARKGIGLIPEDRRIFSDLSVRANLEVAIKPSTNGTHEWDLDRVFKLFPRLKERQKQAGGMLSGGEQQMLTIARSLMGNPKLLLTDEPSEGLSPMMVREVKNQILKLQEEGLTMLLVEQNADFALGVSNRAYVLDKGEVKYSGSTTELRENTELRKNLLCV